MGADTPMPRRLLFLSAAKKTPLQRGFHKVGGTGLEPVTPSLSTRGERSGRFAEVRSGRMVERHLKASERFSERERTPGVAIVATRLPTFRRCARTPVPQGRHRGQQEGLVRLKNTSAYARK